MLRLEQRNRPWPHRGSAFLIALPRPSPARTLVFLLYQKGRDSRIFQAQDHAIDDFTLIAGHCARRFYWKDGLCGAAITPSTALAGRRSARVIAISRQSRRDFIIRSSFKGPRGFYFANLDPRRERFGLPARHAGRQRALRQCGFAAEVTTGALSGSLPAAITAGSRA